MAESKLTDLIAKLEAATGGSRELDRELMLLIGGAREVDQFTYYGPNEETWYCGDHEHETDIPPLPYLSSSVDAVAVRVSQSDYRLYSVDASIEGRFSVVLKGPDRLWPATEDQEECAAPGWESGVAPTLPLALCIALCRALQTGEGHDSDCALHNEPAYPNGPCDCSRSIPATGRL